MSPNAGFVLMEEIAPRLKAVIPHIKPVGAEDAEELLQDSLCVAAKMLHDLETRGKQVTPGNVCYYVTLPGRRSRWATCLPGTPMIPRCPRQGLWTGRSSSIPTTIDLPGSSVIWHPGKTPWKWPGRAAGHTSPSARSKPVWRPICAITWGIRPSPTPPGFRRGAGTSWLIMSGQRAGPIGAGIRQDHHRTDQRERVGSVVGKKSLPTMAGSFF